MKFTDAEQAEMLDELGAVSATITGKDPINVVFIEESEPVVYDDGTVEHGKPYCIATSKGVKDGGVVHGTKLVIDGVSWYVIGTQRKRSGFYMLTLSKTA